MICGQRIGCKGFRKINARLLVDKSKCGVLCSIIREQKARSIRFALTLKLSEGHDLWLGSMVTGDWEGRGRGVNSSARGIESPEELKFMKKERNGHHDQRNVRRIETLQQRRIAYT